jgi:aldose 1-epimerase
MKKVQSYTLKIPNEIEVTFLNYGGIIQRIVVPDKKKKMDDVVLGFDDIEDYQKDHPYFGSLIGRYGNRISQGKFNLNNKKYTLAVNNGPNSLHGGLRGFDKVMWDVQKNSDGHSYTLSYQSPDGDEGYPGNLKVEVTYTISQSRELVIDYRATTDQQTPINLTNHTYFNLAGTTTNSILDHELWINADHYTAVDKDLTPTGEIFSAKGAKDFREHKKIGQDIEHINGGYDYNYVLNDAPLFDPKARLYHHASGRTLEVFTTEPGLQFYSGNFLDGSIRGKEGIPYQKYHGLCLETQHFPDSPNHSNFPTTILKPGEAFTSKTIYRFS